MKPEYIAVGIVAVVGLFIVMNNNNNQTAAPAPQGGNGDPTDNRSSLDRALSGLGSLLGSGISSYAADRARQREQELARDNKSRSTGNTTRQNSGARAQP